MQGKNVLITGGSSGIGFELAKVFLQKNNHCCLVALDNERLDRSFSELNRSFPNAHIIKLGIDISNPESPGIIYSFTQEHSFIPDVVINNAGFGTYGETWINNMKVESKMIDLHISSLYKLTRLFLNDMIKRDDGSIVNISSISAFQPSPYLNTYAATKAFVYHFTRGLQAELIASGSHVKAITICPTPVRTNFGENTDIYRSGLFESWMAVDVDMVAESIYQSISSGKTYSVPGRFYHYLSYITRILPEWVQIKIARAKLKPKT